LEATLAIISNNQPRATNIDEQLSLSNGKSLITGASWDCYNLESLLPLKETHQETTKFGFLLRHYWLPETVLTFRKSLQTTFKNGRLELRDFEIERQLARCRSNECLWREKIYPVKASNENAKRSVIREVLCSYDCYEQTFIAAQPILFMPLNPWQIGEARRQALSCLPFVCPPGPVPLGFSWYAQVGNDSMNYYLEDERHIGDTSVLVIRRKGCCKKFVPQANHGEDALFSPFSETSGTRSNEGMTCVIEREGITLFAWNRGIVLEDRVFDRVVAVGEDRLVSVEGAANQTILRLIRSSPENRNQ
jgi:hypothetical protein